MDVVFSNVSDIFGLIMLSVNSFLTFIQSNPVLWASVVFALVGGVILFAIGVIRKFGVRGLASSGRRRRRRRG